MINDITKVIEQRKNELNSLLKRGDEISPEIKHQIYGALNEIDIFLRTLNYHRNVEIENEIKELKLVKPEKRQNPFFGFFKSKKVKENEIKENRPQKK